MGYTEQIAQIKIILSAVDGVGRVYDYDRWSKGWDTFINYFKVVATGKINGWMISRFKVDEMDDSKSHNQGVNHFRIRGIYGLKDSDMSEITFQNIIENIRAAFRSSYQLNGTATHTTPLNVPVIDNRIFGSVLCHYCEMTLTAEEQNPWST